MLPYGLFRTIHRQLSECMVDSSGLQLSLPRDEAFKLASLLEMELLERSGGAFLDKMPNSKVPGGVVIAKCMGIEIVARD